MNFFLRLTIIVCTFFSLNLTNYISSPSTVGDDTPRYNFINTDGAMGYLQPKYFPVGSSKLSVPQKINFPFSYRWVGDFANYIQFFSHRPSTSGFGYFRPVWPFYPLPTVTGGNASAQPQLSVSDAVSRIGFYATRQFVNTYTLEGFLSGKFSAKAKETGIFSVDYMYAQLKKKNTWLLIGSYWSPLGIKENLPHAVSNTRGSPFTSNDRFPQILIAHDFDRFRIFLIGYNQDLNSSLGPDYSLYSDFTGFNPEYHLRGVLPAVCVRTEYVGNQSLFGGIIDFKRLQPRYHVKDTRVDDGYITSLIGSIYYFFANQKISFKAQFFYGANGTDHLMLGGYAVKSAIPDDITARRSYANTYFSSSWLSIESNKPIHGFLPGLFIGFTNNLGSRYDLFEETYLLKNSSNETILYKTPLCYSLTTRYANPYTSPYPGIPLKSINNIFLIAPRVWFYFSETIFIGAEINLNRTTFGYLDKKARATIKPEASYLFRPTLGIKCYFS